MAQSLKRDATTQALLPKPFVYRVNDNRSVEQRGLTLQKLIITFEHLLCLTAEFSSSNARFQVVSG